MTSSALTGQKLRVWAPDAATVEAELDGGQRAPMLREDAEPGGWWATQRTVPPGADYRFSIDGGDPRPDPRSRWQPAGPDGPSRTLDPSAFSWTDQGWQPPDLAGALFYEAHIGTFSAAGTFDGAIEHLDHLASLGVTHLGLMPVAEFPGARGWGYDGVNLFAPHQQYGGPEGLARLVDASHARGIAVALDVVYNHLGPAANYLGEFGPYFTDRYKTPWGLAVNLDGPGSDEVRRLFIDNALMWVRDYHVDALRLDAVHAIVDTSAIHFLEQLASEVQDLGRQLGRKVSVIAESDLNDPRLVARRAAGGYGLDAQWSDDFHHALHSVLCGEHDGYYADFGSLADLAMTLNQGFRYAGEYSPFRGRRHGRPLPKTEGNRLLGYLQNHDQIGNRARGDRSAALMSSGRLMIGAAVVLAAPFVPMLFQGEEWAASTPFQYFTDHDAELGRAVSEGRRREFASFGWSPDDVPDPQASATFNRSRLDWTELARPGHAQILDWHRQLIALRRQRPELRDGRLDQVEVEFGEGKGWLRFTRGAITVAFNTASASRNVELPNEMTLLLGSAEAIRLQGARVVLPPDSVAVLASD